MNLDKQHRAVAELRQTVHALSWMTRRVRQRLLKGPRRGTTDDLINEGTIRGLAYGAGRLIAPVATEPMYSVSLQSRNTPVTFTPDPGSSDEPACKHNPTPDPEAGGRVIRDGKSTTAGPRGMR